MGLKDRLIAILTNIRLGWKSLTVTNTLAYYIDVLITGLKNVYITSHRVASKLCLT
jgi:hypothetical protein